MQKTPSNVIEFPKNRPRDEYPLIEDVKPELDEKVRDRLISVGMNIYAKESVGMTNNELVMAAEIAIGALAKRIGNLEASRYLIAIHTKLGEKNAK